MVAVATQITSLTIVYSTVYSGADQRKHQSSASLAFVRWIHRWPVTGEFPALMASNAKMFPFDDVIMNMTNPDAASDGKVVTVQTFGFCCQVKMKWDKVWQQYIYVIFISPPGWEQIYSLWNSKLGFRLPFRNLHGSFLTRFPEEESSLYILIVRYILYIFYKQWRENLSHV